MLNSKYYSLDKKKTRIPEMNKTSLFSSFYILQKTSREIVNNITFIVLEFDSIEIWSEINIIFILSYNYNKMKEN